MPRLMYTPHPPDNRLHAFVTNSLVEAARNDVSLRFSEFRAMRQTVEELAREIDNANPNLILFFATGAIPFMIPAMHCLYDRKVYDLVDGSHFHMFPGLSWNGKLNGVDSETFFATEFGSLVESHASKTGSVRIWTMDATFPPLQPPRLADSQQFPHHAPQIVRRRRQQVALCDVRQAFEPAPTHAAGPADDSPSPPAGLPASCPSRSNSSSASAPGWLLVPYLAWVSFGTVLNLAICRLN